VVVAVAMGDYLLFGGDFSEFWSEVAGCLATEDCYSGLGCFVMVGVYFIDALIDCIAER
jgi:hypothetical protein